MTGGCFILNARAPFGKSSWINARKSNIYAKLSAYNGNWRFDDLNTLPRNQIYIIPDNSARDMIYLQTKCLSAAALNTNVFPDERSPADVTSLTLPRVKGASDGPTLVVRNFESHMCEGQVFTFFLLLFFLSFLNPKCCCWLLSVSEQGAV